MRRSIGYLLLLLGWGGLAYLFRKVWYVMPINWQFAGKLLLLMLTLGAAMLWLSGVRALFLRDARTPKTPSGRRDEAGPNIHS